MRQVRAQVRARGCFATKCARGCRPKLGRPLDRLLRTEDTHLDRLLRTEDARIDRVLRTEQTTSTAAFCTFRARKAAGFFGVGHERVEIKMSRGHLYLRC
jgi:hypothetical protein